MKKHTARQVVSDETGMVADIIAKARGCSPERVAREAKAMLRKLNRRERQHRGI